ncbi:MAG TPA: TIGR03790 family protein [Tepidisphaeraceae bacterium]|jgi:uncharacterized protein (TIGR03790 family)
MSPLGRRGRIFLPLLALLLFAVPAFALEPDAIALVVNANVPESRTLAELYAHERHIPDGRIIAIDLDPGVPSNPAEEMPFDAYEPRVAGPIREFLTRNKLNDRIKCLVTFWGMPLRIGRRQLTAQEKGEAAQLPRDLADAQAAIAQGVAAIEKSATEVDPTYKPLQGDDVISLGKRLDAATPVIVKAMPGMKDPAARAARYSQIVSVLGRMLGVDRTTLLMTQPSIALFSPAPPTRQDVAAAQGRLADAERQIAARQTDTATAADRATARAIARDNLGLFGYAFVVTGQLKSLDVDQSESALDSELSLLWWQGYARARWVVNPLEWRVREAWRKRPGQPPVTLMVTRLDGPSIPVVRDLILTSIKVENEGLRGQIAIDARGKTGNDPYAQYDQHLQKLAAFLRAKTKLQVTFENTEALIPEHSLKYIAVYCGWYSLRNYVPPGSFSPGAVGYHVASSELVSLRAWREHGWVRGLLSDGVVGTLGPVAEPYLQSFPLPDEFVPLLLTGRLTLAEVYWRTVPWSSWMQTCIGDPLYNPYRRDPQLAVGDLPGDLRAALGEDASNVPATQPVSSGR